MWCWSCWRGSVGTHGGHNKKCSANRPMQPDFSVGHQPKAHHTNAHLSKTNSPFWNGDNLNLSLNLPTFHICSFFCWCVLDHSKANHNFLGQNAPLVDKHLNAWGCNLNATFHVNYLPKPNSGITVDETNKLHGIKLKTKPQKRFPQRSRQQLIRLPKWIWSFKSLKNNEILPFNWGTSRA